MLTVQLVDADRPQRAARARVLAKAGYRIVQSGGLGRAFSQLLRERPLVSLVALWPNPSDAQAFRQRARLDPRTAQIPFIFLGGGRAEAVSLSPEDSDRMAPERITGEALVRAVGEAIENLTHGAEPGPEGLNLLRLEVHDLKAPLANIISLSELLLSEEVEVPQRDEFIASIAANARSMLKLVVNLLNVSALESGRLNLRLESVLPHELIQLATQQIAWQIRRKGARSENRVPHDLPALRGDRDLLVRLFMNLLDNALQYSHAGDEILIHGQADREGVRIDVLDRGPGVPEAQRENIFEEFFRGSSGLGSSHSTGLGLAYCRLAAEAHEGRIWVDDRDGGGSRFSVFLPFAPVDPG